MIEHQFRLGDRVYDRRKILAVVLTALFASLLQVSSVNNLLPAIGHSFNASNADLQWIISGYALALAIMLIPSGRLGDMLGRSSVFMWGLVLFVVASLGIGLSTSALMLNMLRVVQGVAAGVFNPQVTGLIQQLFTGQARARAFAIFGAAVSVSFAAGPVISGALVGLLGDETGWRASFFINVPAGIVAIILALRWLPFTNRKVDGGGAAQPAESSAGRSERRRRIDLDPVGAALLMAGVVSFMVPFMNHPHPAIWALVPVGLVLMAGWVVWEQGYKARGHQPMVDMDIFKIRSLSYGTATVSFQTLGFSTVFVILSLFFQNGLGLSALTVGLLFLPHAVVSALASLGVGRFMVRYGVLLQPLSSLVIALGSATAIAAIWAMSYGASHWWIIPPTMILGLGIGCFAPANTNSAMHDVPPESGGTASGIQQTGQRMANAVGIAIIPAAVFWAQRTFDSWYVGAGVGFAFVTVTVGVAAIIGWLFYRSTRA